SSYITPTSWTVYFTNGYWLIIFIFM
ncbi:uncharacterized protein METZ01_LOCUS490946, partial [marine metagenome]